MKRSAIKRKTPLRPTGFLKRREWKPKRKKKDILPSVRAFVQDRSQGVCERPGPVCTHWATDMHHIKRRSQLGEHTATNLIHLCHADHMYVHANVAWAKEHGYLA